MTASPFAPFPLQEPPAAVAERNAAFLPPDAGLNYAAPLERAASVSPAALTDGELLMTVLDRHNADLADLMAERLLKRFGTLQAVLCADQAALAAEVGEAAALDIRIIAELSTRAARANLLNRCLLTSYTAVVAYLRTSLAGRPREAVVVLFLDKKNRLIADEIVGEGTLDHAPVYPREIIRRALELNCAAILISHHHPSGDPTPSRADIDMTKKIQEAAAPLGIALHDHIVMACGSEVSMRAKGLL